MKIVMVVKRKGHKERFDERKLYGSVYAACASAHYNERKCEKIALEITEKMKSLMSGRKSISSSAIRQGVVGALGKKDKELAFFYKEHLPNLKQL